MLFYTNNVHFLLKLKKLFIRILYLLVLSVSLTKYYNMVVKVYFYINPNRNNRLFFIYLSLLCRCWPKQILVKTSLKKSQL